MDNPVIIFGANDIGKAAKAIFESNNIVVYGFLDDDQKLHGQEIDDITVLGAMEDDGFLKLIDKKAEAFVAADDNKVRKSIVALLKDRRKVMPVNAIHKNAKIDDKAHLGHGNFINNGAVISAYAEVASHCLIQAGAIIDSNSKLGDFVQVGAGAVINNSVKIGENAFIGTGAVIVSGIKIGKGARVGAGSLVIADVGANETVFGNPAQKVD